MLDKTKKPYNYFNAFITYFPGQPVSLCYFPKEPVGLSIPASSAAKQAVSQTSKPSVRCGRSHSLSSRGSDSTAGGSRSGGSLKGGSLGQQGSRQASRSARPVLRLCSSRSFSSLHNSAAPFMRSSRSLNRLDQRSPAGDSDREAPSTQAKKKPRENVKLTPGQLSSPEEPIRDTIDQCHDEKAEEMKTRSPCEPTESPSSLVSTPACHQHCSKTSDGVHNAMTCDMKHNWVQAVLKNVLPSFTPDVTGSLSQHHDSQSAEELKKADHSNSFLQEQEMSDFAGETHPQQKEEELQREEEQRSPVSPPRQVKEGVTHPSLCDDGVGSGSKTSTEMQSNVQRSGERSDAPSKTEQSWQLDKVGDGESMKENNELPRQRKTGQLVKELEQTRRDVSRLQQLNRNLQDELQRERARPSRDRARPENDLPSNSNEEQASAVQKLQKINNDLRLELEAKTWSQEKAREVELRQRVDLLAQQAQLLVTGDATALAQAHLEQDRLRFHEQQTEWERCVASLKTQLSSSDEKRKEAEARFKQLQQELQSYHTLQQEAERLHRHLQEVTTELHANEEAQAQKEARLQKHLTLLQESQDRERRSLASSLAQAEQHSRELQERLDRAEQHVEAPTWTRDVEEAQQQLQEELACTVSAVQQLQGEKEQLDRRCRALQDQLCEADGEVSRLQSRLKTEETDYYNLEHSFERVSEDLQLALGKVQQSESETQDIREGYERLLDRKEQELSEVLLKMEILGNSLEETEVKLNEVLKGCTCNPSQPKDEYLEPGQQNERQTDLLTRSESRPENSSNAVDRAGDDPEKFLSVIKVLESKLYVTEEKLRDILQRLQEPHGHYSCQDPHLCSQLTQSRAGAQHLSLLLHTQAKQSKRFAQETESRCRVLVGRFHFALNILRACAETLRGTQINLTDLEKQLTTVASCLRQGETDAEIHQRESHAASKAEDKILRDEALAAAESGVSGESKPTGTLPSSEDVESVGKCLMRELFVVEKMVSVLQSPRGVEQQPLEPREDEGHVAHKHKSIILKAVTSSKACRAECLERAISGVCAEAELIYAAFKCPQQANDQEAQLPREALSDTGPPELVPYEMEVRGKSNDSEGAAVDEADVQRVEAEKPEWLKRLVLRLRRRATFLQQLCREVSDGHAVECSTREPWEKASAADLHWMQEQARLIYLWERLYSDLEQQQSVVLQDRLEALCEEQDNTLKDELEAFNHTLCQLQEDNSVLRGELERAQQRIMSGEAGNQRLSEDLRKIDDYHDGRMQEMETEFQEKIKELQQIHEEEMKHLHGYYASSLPEQTVLERKTMPSNGAVATGEPYQKDLERQGASRHEDVAARQEMQRQLIFDLQQQHRTEVAALLKERDKLLQEETAATMAAIVAMRRAHKQELEKSRQSQRTKDGADVAQLHIEHEKDLRSMHKELEVLSVQHSQKCLENSQLTQELQDERRSSTQHQKENQELKKKQRDEMSQMSRLLRNGKQTHVSPKIKDFYEMEVVLRAREAEMQFLRQEARSLQEDLKIARMDKIYAENKLKALHNSQDESHHDVDKLLGAVEFATWSPGQTAEDAVTKTNNAGFLRKTVKSTLTRQIRGVRSKSLKDGLSVQERMKLFE
ncbi:uncharacterized protein AB9W97_022480 isoform 2-T2 [Spinachia spinachia]